MSDFLEQWANANDENARLVAQETLIAFVTEAIWAAMEQAEVSKSELARRMGVTKGHVTQLLSGSRNMTLRTLADIAGALGYTAHIAFDPQAPAGDWQTLRGAPATPVGRRVHYRRSGNVLYPAGGWWQAAA